MKDKLTLVGEQNLMVCVRIRPISEEEIISGSNVVAHTVDDSVVVLLDPLEDPDDILRANRSRERQFVFDKAFDGNSTQEEVYESTTKFLISNVARGYNATVFAYGATGAGKTYTMLGTDREPGIMYRTLEDLFQEMQKTAEDSVYKFTMSYLEIYNEQIRDLLNPASGVLDMREDTKGGVQVAGLSEIQANSTGEVMRLLMQGNQARTTEPTAANETSSRSHAVLQITVLKRSRVRDITEEVHTGKLFLIDLAGSERAAHTQNRGKRMLEGAHINRSLLALGNCINALADKSGSRYVNFRDSKLTRLLKEALGGNCKTVMIANISPASDHFEDSRNTLVYSDRAKEIRTKVRRNVTDVSHHIAQYTSVINELRQEIFRLRGRLEGGADAAGPLAGHRGHQHSASQRRVFNTTKEQMLLAFQEVMELRKGVMSLDNTLGDLALEIGRSNLLISQYEIDRVVKSPASGRQSASEDSGAHSANEDHEEPEEVRAARAELGVLGEEKLRCEKIRYQAVSELTLARDKAKKLEDGFRVKLSSHEEQEILRLLSQLNALEMENAEVQAEAFLKSMEIRKRDLLLSRFSSHSQLCHAIISKQKLLLLQAGAALPGSLRRMYELYDRGAASGEDAVFQKSLGVSLPDLDQLENQARVLNVQQSGGQSATPQAGAQQQQQQQQQADRLFHHTHAAADEPDGRAGASSLTEADRHEMAAATRALMSKQAQLTSSRLAWHNSGVAGYLSEDDLLSDRRSIWTDNTWMSRTNRQADKYGYAKALEKRNRKNASLEPARVDVSFVAKDATVGKETRAQSMIQEEPPAGRPPNALPRRLRPLPRSRQQQQQQKQQQQHRTLRNAADETVTDLNGHDSKGRVGQQRPLKLPAELNYRAQNRREQQRRRRAAKKVAPRAEIGVNGHSFAQRST